MNDEDRKRLADVLAELHAADDAGKAESKRAEAERLRREVDAVNARLPEGLTFGYGRLDELEAEEAAEGGPAPAAHGPDDLPVPVVRWLDCGKGSGRMP